MRKTVASAMANRASGGSDVRCVLRDWANPPIAATNGSGILARTVKRKMVQFQAELVEAHNACFHRTPRAFVDRSSMTRHDGAVTMRHEQGTFPIDSHEM